MLSKALQINTTLRSVTWDRNNTSATGFLDVARALEHNFTLQYMPLPLSDISQAYRSTSERTEQALTKIQRALLRNNQTQRFSQRQALRLHQGLVTSTAEQVMERLSVCVQQQVCVLRGVGEMEEIQAAKQVLKEARNSRALYPSLCELAHVLSVDGPVRQRLDQLAGELTRAADKELQVIVDSMVSLCRELCPLSSSAAERLRPQLLSVSERVSIPRSAIRTALMERAAQDIHRALEEVKLSVVSYLTNSIVDQILQELYATHKTLTRRVSQVKRWEVTCDGGTGLRSHRHRDSLDLTDDEMGTSIDTIAIKKRSSRTRRIRPVSTRLSQCDDSSSSTPPSVSSSFSSFSALSRSTSWEGLSELPTQGAPLHHVTRVRPRPPRRHRAGHAPSDTHCTENGAVTPIDHGLPDFYTKRVLPDSQLSSLHKAHSLRRKKRRNMLAIFGFRRNRNSTLSNQGPDSGGDGCGEECRTVAMAPTGTATENVYTLLQPPLSAARAGSPGEGGDVEDQRLEEPVGLSLQPVQSIPPQPGMPGSRHPFYSLSQLLCPTHPYTLSIQHTLTGPYTPIYTVNPTHTHRALHTHIHCQSNTHSQGPTHPYTLSIQHILTPLFQSELETEHEQPADIDGQVDRQWTEGNHTVRERTLIRPADRQAEQHWPEDKPSDKTWTEGRTADRYWTESRHADRHMERQWTVDRQFDQDRQWTVSRQQTDRTWAEGRPKDIQIDSRQSGRQTDRQDQGRHLAQRPLPPYPSDRTPSPKSETDSQKNMDRQKYSDTQTDRHLRSDTAVGQVEGWWDGGGVPPGRVSTSASKPDPPSQSSKPNLSKLRQRHLQESSGTEEAGRERDGGRMERKERERDRDAEGQPPPIPEKPKTSSYVSSPNEYANERPIPTPASSAFRKPLLGLAYRAVSQGEEAVRPRAPVKPQRNRKAMSCDTGTDRDSPNNLEKPSNRKPPVKKPRLPQNRNKSLDYPDSVNLASGNSKLL
uniref:CARMIL C-terminal domain-containing protein n=1 Tax=Oncorhynchus kisutch TaxID=8019 RepID=A0A8C7L3L2_ONCKI